MMLMHQEIKMTTKYAVFLLVALCLISAAIAETPTETPVKGLVNDYAGIFTPEEKVALTAQLDGLYATGAAQFAIVTVNNMNGMDSFNYAYEISEGVVGDAETNNGLVLLVAVEERQHRFLTGRGLEGVLPDALLSRISQQYLVPNFKQESYAQGLLEVTNAVEAIVTQDTESSYYATPPKAGFSVLAFIFRNPFLILIFIFLIINLTRKDGKKHRDGDLIAGLLLGSMLGRGRGGGGFGGGGSFGGFGGGGFGGGGAGGGW